MDIARIDELLGRMQFEEIEDALWFIDASERCGNMDATDADEWRRRIVARRRFLELDEGDAADE